MKNVSIVVLNYRTAELTLDCLRSLESEVATAEDCRVYVVDNASGDDSLEHLHAFASAGGRDRWLEVVASPRNGGFGAGNNVALRRILATADRPADYILFLNSDTYVRPGAVAALYEFLEGRPDVGIAGSRLEDPDGAPQHSRFRFHTPWTEFNGGLGCGPLQRLMRYKPVAPPMSDEAHAIDWLAGASMMVRRAVLDDVDLFDEHYFLYYEEQDLTFRARRAGWTCWYVPSSRVVHLVGQSTNATGVAAARRRMPRYWFESRRLYFAKNHGLASAMLADAATITGHLLGYVWRFVRRKVTTDPKYYLRDVIRHSVLFPAERHRIREQLSGQATVPSAVAPEPHSAVVAKGASR